MSAPKLRTYEVGVKGTTWTREVTHVSAGKAKYEYLRDVQESWPTVNFPDITCRSLGRIAEDEAVRMAAELRDLPPINVGTPVLMNGQRGIIVGVDSGANLRVLFSEGPSANHIGHCHPHWRITYFSKDGEILREYGD